MFCLLKGDKKLPVSVYDSIHHIKLLESSQLKLVQVVLCMCFSCSSPHFGGGNDAKRSRKNKNVSKNPDVLQKLVVPGLESLMMGFARMVVCKAKHSWPKP